MEKGKFPAFKVKKVSNNNTKLKWSLSSVPIDIAFLLFLPFPFRYSTPLNYFHSTAISLTFHHIVDADGKNTRAISHIFRFSQRRNSSNFIEQTFFLFSFEALLRLLI